jgi:hypothetical protein
MPISPASLSSSIYSGLVSVGLHGQATSKLADGVSKGLAPWVKSITVVTADTGTAGVGVGVAPWLLIPQVLVTNLLACYTVNGHLGPKAPQEAAGLGFGIALGFAQGLITTTHPVVGSGVAVPKFVSSPAFPFLISGFASVQMVGVAAAKKANAISQALAMTLAVFTLSIPIVGPVTPSGISGVGVGQII